MATRESYNSRFSSRSWTERLQHFLPKEKSILLNWRDELLDDSVPLLSAEEIPSRITTVPKTMKTPRVIAMEPVYNQYVQQGLLRTMTSVLYTPKFQALQEGLGWRHQDWNRLLAKIGSEKNSLATIDLSEASDRVSHQLIEHGLLPCSPSLFRGLSIASRSERAKMPDGEIIPLRKFASMGSALTFPFETMVFFTIIHLAWEKHYGVFPSAPLGPDQGVRVYGDDIIVPVSLVPTLISELELFGLKVNTNKSFWNGSFRESCGADWVSGISVSPVRLRAPLPDRSDSFSNIARSVEFHNRLFEAGFFETCEYLQKELSSIAYIPYIPYGFDAIGFHTYDSSKIKTRYNSDLQVLEVKVLALRGLKPKDDLDGYGALSKFFHNTGEYPISEGHLERDGRSQCVGLNIAWRCTREGTPEE